MSTFLLYRTTLPCACPLHSFLCLSAKARTSIGLLSHKYRLNSTNLAATPSYLLSASLARTSAVSIGVRSRSACALALHSKLDNKHDEVTNASNYNKPRVVILTGPTAVGKTAISLQLAKSLGGEIISADSVQVYRGLNIGSDKLPIEERQGIPHHVIDLLDPQDDFSAGDFYTVARKVTEDIINRGRVPIVVGGTAFYLRWFIFGKPSTPKSTATQQQAVEDALTKAFAAAGSGIESGQLSEEHKWEAAVQLVDSLGDPRTADRLREIPNNWYRLKRALEILITTGQPLSDLDIDTSQPLDYDFRCYFLHRPRLQLYRRIDKRCEEMMAAGVLQEASWLLSLGLHPNTNSATRAIGYRQTMEMLKKCVEEGGEVTQGHVLQMLSSVQAASRQFCHRQLTWFRDDAMWWWVDAAQDSTAVVQQIIEAYQQEKHEGFCGNSGRLTKEEHQQMRQYITELHIFNDKNMVETLRKQMADLVRNLPMNATIS